MKKQSLLKLTFVLLAVVFFAASTAGEAQAQTCTENPTSGNSVTTTFSVPETDTYTIWTRFMAPDAVNNSVYIQVDGGCAINVGDSTTIPANAFTWVNYQQGATGSAIMLNLTGGTHTIKLTEREGGVGVDRLLITTNTACVPVGVGDNCPLPTNTPIPTETPTPTLTPTPEVVPDTPTPIPTDTPIPTSTPVPTATPTLVPTSTPTPQPVADTIRPSVTITSPTNGSIITRGTTKTITVNATDNVAVREVRIAVTGKGGNFSCTDTTYPYSCNWGVPSKPSTSYSITATAYDTSNNTASAVVQTTSSK